MKTANRKGLLLMADNYGTRQWFKWYHTNNFIRFQLLKAVRMEQPAISFIQYLFFGESAERVPKPELMPARNMPN